MLRSGGHSNHWVTITSRGERGLLADRMAGHWMPPSLGPESGKSVRWKEAGVGSVT